MRPAVARMARGSAVHVLFAFFVMGDWAVFINRAHAISPPRVGGLVRRAVGLDHVVPQGADCTASHHRIRLGKPAGGDPRPQVHARDSGDRPLPFTVATSYTALYNYSL